jgi:hypothetical protein
VEAIIAGDFIFYDNQKDIIKELDKASLNKASSVRITWWIQKTARKTRQSRLLLKW